VSHVSVLLFHGITPTPRMHSEISSTLFSSCLDLINGLEIPVRSVKECARAARPADRTAVSLTFDDGRESDAVVALPELQRRDFRATFFVTTGLVGTQGFLSWKQAWALVQAGMEIGSHTCSHPVLTRLAPDELDRELRVSKRELEDRLGQSITSLSVPHGFYDARVIAAAVSAGYEHVCVSRPGLNQLPLVAGRPVRRNALHRGTLDGALVHMIEPDRGTLWRWAASYTARAALARVLPETQYARVRQLAMRYLARRR